MLYYFAPMEGLTGSLFRRVHQRYFPGVDRYYTPFLSPTAEHRLTAREAREVLPEEQGGVPTVPQLLGKNAEDLLWAARELAAMGYEEINLNAGCPSGTVVAKGKGAALLAQPAALEVLLGELRGRWPVKLSVKTRLGMTDASEFDALLDIYERAGLCELIVHARTRSEQYKGEVHRDVFAVALGRASTPLCYNGDVRTVAHCRRLEQDFPALGAVMIGRGLAANPALVRQVRGGAPLARQELRDFHDELYAGYTELFGRGVAVQRMKELWACLRVSFPGSERLAGRIARAASPVQFEAAAGEILANLELRPPE